MLNVSLAGNRYSRFCAGLADFHSMDPSEKAFLHPAHTRAPGLNVTADNDLA
jgi:hypothetical protein